LRHGGAAKVGNETTLRRETRLHTPLLLICCEFNANEANDYTNEDQIRKAQGGLKTGDQEEYISRRRDEEEKDLHDRVRKRQRALIL
jgi:hypothetical protein